MNGIVELLGLSTEGILAFGWTMVVRGAALLCIALGIAAALRRAPSALRHHVWTLAMVGLIVLPALALVAPPWRVGLPGTGALSELLASSQVAAALTGAASSDPGSASTWVTRPAESTGPAGDGPQTPASLPAAGSETSARFEAVPGPATADPKPEAAQSAPTLLVPWTALLAGAWVAGFLFLFLRLAAGMVRAVRLVRRADPVTDRRWNVLVSSLCLKSGLDTSVRVVSSSEVGVPMAWGIFGAWLVLPEGIETWPDERRRVVVLHELAHLRRRDCASQALARFALALHWPNPLAWLAVRRMRSERERACDDAVLAAGVGGPAYAHHLVDIARGISSAFRPARAAVAMARPSELENRVLAILDPRRSRRSLGRRTARLGLACLVALLVPVATLHPTAAAEPVASESTAEPDVRGMTFDIGSDAATSAEDEAGAAERTVEPVGEEAGIAVGADPGVLAADDAQLEALAGSGLAGGSRAADADTIEERVFQALLRALESDDANVRRRIAETFGQMESPRAVEPLSALVRSDPDDDVRERAAWALGMIESEASVDALVDAATDEVTGVRQQAAWALGMVESTRGVAPLIPLLDDADPGVRDQAAWGLGMIESAEAVEALGRAFGSEAEAGIRAQIIWALGMIEDRSALDTVVDALEDSDAEVRDQALWALGMIMG